MTRPSWLTAVAWVPILSAGIVLAQFPQPQPIPQPPRAQPADDGPEVLARGPVHEAFASTAEQPAAAEVVAKRPPDAVEELPPDQKPAGDNVQWIPGYWHWDEDRSDFIWISGFWRQPPPGRVWVPGGWREVRGGYQWVQGFWNGTDPQQPQQPQQLEYLPQPPAPLEIAPSVPAPTETCFYTPGVWQWHRNRFAWRPGFWVEHRPNWVWVPAHYRWTPAGHVFIDGYWDHTLAARGVLFAPVAFRPAVLVQPRFVYTPAYVVTDTSLYGSMFVRRGWGNYYFGDYFEARHHRAGFTAWCGASLKLGNFAITVGSVRPQPVFDPLWSYYSVAYRHEPRWQAGVADLYTGRFKGDYARPPHTLVQQNTVIKNVTNVTNITNVTNVTNTNVMLTKLVDVKPAATAPALHAVAQADRVKEQQHAQELRQVGTQRQKLEVGLVDRGRAVAKPTDAPQAVKLELPKTVTARAQVPVSVKVPEAPKPAQANTLTTQPPIGSKPQPPTTIPPAKPLPAPPIPQPVKLNPQPEQPKPQPPVVTPTPMPQPKPPVTVVPPQPQPQPQPKPPVVPPPLPKQPDPKPPVLQPQPLPQPKPPVVNPTPMPLPQPKPPEPKPLPPVVNPTPAPPKPPVSLPPAPMPQPKPPVVPPPPVVQPQPKPPEPKPPAVVVPPVQPKPVVNPNPQPPVAPPQPKPPVVNPTPAPQPMPQPKPPAPPAPVVQPPKPPVVPPAPVVQPQPKPPAPPVAQPQPPKPPAPAPMPPAQPQPQPKPKEKEKEKDKR